MKHIIKLFVPLFLLLTTLASCDQDKKWIYVDPEPQPGLEISGSAAAVITTFRTGAADPIDDNDKRVGLPTTYAWLKAGDLFITETDLEGKATNFGKGQAVSEITSKLVADGSAFKISEEGLYFIVYNATLKQLSIMPAKFGVIGEATPGGWGGETPFTKVEFNEASKTVTMTGSYPLTKSEMKFRFNDWGIDLPYDGSDSDPIKMHTNMGAAAVGAKLGESSTTLKAGGENLSVEVGAQYDVTMELNLGTGVFTAKAVQGEIIEPEFPESLYMIGAEFGDWNWEDEGIVQLTPVNGTIGTFWTIKYFSKDKGFKWAPVRDWSGDFAGMKENIGFEVKDGNAFVPENGLYMVYIDMVADKMVIEKPKVHGIGDSFDTWNLDVQLFELNEDGKTMSATTLADSTEKDGLRMCASSSLSEGIDWWKMEFILRDGKIEYRGNGGDQNPRVQVTAGQVITLDFSTNSGAIK